MLEKPGAIPISQRIFAPESIAFSLSESGVISLKLKSITLLPFLISISVALYPRFPGSILTNNSSSLDIFLQYSIASVTCIVK